MKLYRCVACRNRYYSDEIVPKKVYSEASLRRWFGRNGWSPEEFECVADLPIEEMPTTIYDVRAFCDEWIRFLIGDVAKGWDSADRYRILRGVVEGLRRAMIALPDAPSLPESRPVRYSDLLSVVEELKRFRDWVPVKRPSEGDSAPSTVTPSSDSAKASRPNRGKQVNARMLEKMQKDPSCHGWTCTEWAKFLKCSKPSVTDSPTWKMLESIREKQKAERAMDRHRRPKGSDQRRAKGQD
jgi:hypothetical protein